MVAGLQDQYAVSQEALTNCEGDLGRCQSGMPDPVLLEIRPALDTVTCLMLVWILACALWDAFNYNPRQFPGNRCVEMRLYKLIFIYFILSVVHHKGKDKTYKRILKNLEYLNIFDIM